MALPDPQARRRWIPLMAVATAAAAALHSGPAAAQASPPAASAAPLEGSRSITLHARDGSSLRLGSVRFTPQADGRSTFALALDSAPFKDFFLSMKEFKCVEGQGEIFCHVPYPYPQPGSVGPGDLAWLEHALLFMFKTPSEFGARLWNGVYWRLSPTATGGFEGRPQAIDLNRISAPPAKAGPPYVPPYGAAQRDDIPSGARWFGRLTVE